MKFTELRIRNTREEERDPDVRYVPSEIYVGLVGKNTPPSSVHAQSRHVAFSMARKPWEMEGTGQSMVARLKRIGGRGELSVLPPGRFMSVISEALGA